MGNLYARIVSQYQENKYLILLIASMLICAPSAMSFEWLTLKPSAPTSIFFRDFWRLILSHFTHSNWPHLLINTVNVIMLRLVVREWIIDKRIIIFIVYSALIISIGLHIIHDLTSYVGFSGIFYSLLIYVLLTHIKHSPKLYGLTALAVIIKVGHEQWYGASLAISQIIETSIAIDAHALGVLSGISLWALDTFLTARKAR